MTRRRVVLLSHGDSVVPELLTELDARGVRPYALVLYTRGVWRDWRALPGRQRARALPLLPLRWIRRRVRRRVSPDVRSRVEHVVTTGVVNGRAMTEALRRLEPDVLVLAGCHILRPDVLAIPREGTINVHAGLLPWVRGNGAVENSILLDVPLGCTALWVDDGVDTGPVIARRLVPVAGGETARDLYQRVRALWIEMTASLVAAATEGPIAPGTPQRARFPLGYAVRDPAARARVAELIAAGAPAATFACWKAACDQRDLSLAAGLESAPAPIARRGRGA